MIMIRFYWAVFVFLWAYLYCYSVYFCIIIILSVFHIKLGFSEAYVHTLSYVFQYTDSLRQKSAKDSEEDLPTNENNSNVSPVRRNSANTTNELDSKLYSVSVLHNGAIPKYSNTIRRGIILLPEFQDEFHVQLVDKSDDEEPNFSVSPKNVFELSDITMYIRAGIEAIVEDQITSRFEAEKLESWNLLTRTNPNLRFYNFQAALLWFIGLLVRYLVLFPIRLLNCFTGLLLLTICMTIIGYTPNSKYKKHIFKRINTMCFNVLAQWLGCVLRFHDVENRTQNGIVVSNHTTPFDVLMLNVDQCYSLIGQRHKGFIGFLERTLSRASPHIWFERSLISDREAVAKKLQKHARDTENPPILLFPEGTCINNTAVTQFKKGGFEVSDVVHPIAIKYDTRYGNPFWNSSQQTAIQHVLEMMTSWCILGDIWYLSPVIRKPNETSVQFANRVKRKIAKQMNVIDLTWDGQVKRAQVKPEWKNRHQKLFYEKLKSRLRQDIE